MENNNSTPQQIQTLEEIVLRKEMVLNELHNDDKKIQELWSSLFHVPDLSASTPTKRLTKFINIGAGALDGAILAWTLYRKFKKKR